MKISDCVEVIAESEKYTAGGVHKGMQGKIEYHSNGFDRWCVSFPNCTDRPTEIRLCINTSDLKLLPDGIDPKINEEIRRKFGEFVVGDGFMEMDCIKVIVEKKRYVEEGVHKGMYGWICNPERVNGYWLVNFPQCYDKEDIATTSIHEDDMVRVPVMHAIINEEIKEKFGD